MKTTLLTLLFVTAPLFAHDMWMEPASFFAESGQLLSIRLKVGQNLLGDPLPRSAGLINEFIVEDGSGRRPIIGREGSDPAGYLRISNPGLQVIGYYSKPSSVDLPAEKFNEYLKEEGLDAIAALRARRKEMGNEVKELFSRCAKSLVSSGSPGTTADRILGFPLELVAERNPYAMTAGESLPVQLLHEKRPLVGALVIAVNRMNPALKQSARTDKNGRVKLKLGSGGMWMIKAVHMTPAQGADYQSLWASLTFELRDAAAVSKK